MNLRIGGRLAGWFLALVLVAGAMGCSSFRSDAKRVRASKVPAEGVEGLWVGRWHDEKRPDHGGEIQCVLTRTGDQMYRLSSRSRWWKWFTSALDTTVVLTPVRPGAYEVRGGRDIWAFGEYSIAGQVDRTLFEATYQASGQRGRIRMERPPE